MMLNQGRKNPFTDLNFQTINHRVLMGRGDRDTMVTLEETVRAYQALPNGQLFVMPDTPHPLEKIRVNPITSSIREFFLE